MHRFLFIFLLFTQFNLTAQSYQIAVLKYQGGGDWYANLETSLPNLIDFCRRELDMNISEKQAIVEAESEELFDYPFVHMTGHGNVIFSQSQAVNLRNYLLAGGFLHIDDNYGMDPYIRRELKKVFPNDELVELPFDHPIFHQEYDFNNGLPKIHEHDEKPPQGFGIIKNGRLVLFYTYESDLGDGWEDPEIHNDSQSSRLKALRMGANILSFVFTGQLNNE